MDRPKISGEVTIYELHDHAINLEVYSTELEEELEKYKKAVDKLCEMLVDMKRCANCWEFMEHCPWNDKCHEGFLGCTEDGYWKVWALRGAEDDN